jgi:hypothetical protein
MSTKVDGQCPANGKYSFRIILLLLYLLFTPATTFAQKSATGWTTSDDTYVTNENGQVMATLPYKAVVTIVESAPDKNGIKVKISGWLHPPFSQYAHVEPDNKVKFSNFEADLLEKPDWAAGRLAKIPVDTLLNFSKKIIKGDNAFFYADIEGYIDTHQITSNANELKDVDKRRVKEAKIQEVKDRESRFNAFADLSGVFIDNRGSKKRFSKVMFEEKPPSIGLYTPEKMLRLSSFILLKSAQQSKTEVQFKDIKKIVLSSVPKGETGDGWAEVSTRSGKTFAGGLVGNGGGDVDIYFKVDDAEVSAGANYQMSKCSIEFD